MLRNPFQNRVQKYLQTSIDLDACWRGRHIHFVVEPCPDREQRLLCEEEYLLRAQGEDTGHYFGRDYNEEDG